MREQNKKNILFAVIAIMLVFSLSGMKAKAAEDGLTEAKNGIVEILSGFMDPSGTFRCIKTSSGFLISNTDGNTYLLTTNHCAVVTNEEKAAYCTNNQLQIDLSSVQDSIKVIVKGDVITDAAIVAQSAESDFCILSVSDVIHEKTALKFGNNSELTTGMTVYAMGFEDDAAAKGAEYSSVDVLVREGIIQNLESNQGGVIYQQHSAIISVGNSGGPLLNAEGYVIGLNNSARSRAEEGIYFSLPINEIREVLDNYNINYSSKEKEETEKSFDSLLEKSQKKYKSGDYKRTSMEALEKAIQQAEELKAKPVISDEELKEVFDQLTAANQKLQKRMPLKEKIMVGLGIVIVLLLLCFLKVVLGYRKEKKASDMGTYGKKAQAREVITAEPEEEKHAADIQDIPKQTDNLAKEKRVTGFETDQDDDSDKTVILGMNRKSSDQTAGLGASEEKFLMREEMASLVKADGKETRIISQPVMGIGKSKDKSDIVIEGNPAVSRVHAQIIWKEQQYYVRDLGSANGTFLNHERIVPNENILLKNGDKLAFADAKFEFRTFKNV